MQAVTVLDIKEIASELALENPKILYGVAWDDYVEMVQESFGKTNLKMSYNRGVLKIMGQGFNHENISRFIEKLLALVGLVLDQEIVSAGSMSLISDRVRKGADPDESYYVQNAHLASFKDEIYDGETDTPPDIVVEIDKSHGSDDKFEIYAAFGIKEFWLYSNGALQIFALAETGEYLLSEKSLALPILSAAVLTEFVGRGQKEKQLKVLKDFQIWLEENK